MRKSAYVGVYQLLDYVQFNRNFYPTEYYINNYVYTRTKTNKERVESKQSL
jgi:predicted SAM-dependent methyltransferase